MLLEKATPLRYMQELLAAEPDDLRFHMKRVLMEGSPLYTVLGESCSSLQIDHGAFGLDGSIVNDRMYLDAGFLEDSASRYINIL